MQAASGQCRSLKVWPSSWIASFHAADGEVRGPKGFRPGIQPVGGDDAGRPPELGLAVDVGQDGDEEVHIGESQHPEGAGR